MFALENFHRTVKSGISSLIGRGSTKTVIEGIPAGLDFNTLNKACHDVFGESLTRVSHIHLSGWKQSGSFRLLLQTVRSRRRSIIYKNAVYQTGQIPALKELPVVPGPPEYYVYGHAEGPLGKYLPDVYLCSEVVPGKHYQYLLEDLSGTHWTAHQPDEIIGAVNELPAIHLAINEWSQVAGHHCLLRFDETFSLGLLEYVQKNLERYAAKASDQAIVKICKIWPQIFNLYKSEIQSKMRNLCPIHGDYNFTNILVNKNDSNQFKLIDWEWAGLGMPHADWASLLKPTTVEIEKQCLDKFCQQYDQFSLDENKRLYQWFKLERGLFDAAFFAGQQMECKASESLKFERAIQKAAKRALQAYHALDM